MMLNRVTKYGFKFNTYRGMSSGAFGNARAIVPIQPEENRFIYFFQYFW